VLRHVKIEPNMADGKRQKLLAGWKEAVKRSMGWEPTHSAQTVIT
jgi:glycerol kinase